MNRVSEGGSTAQFYPPVPQPYFLPKMSEDLLKVGAQLDPDLLAFVQIKCDDRMPHLFEFNQREPLEKIVECLCSHWRMENPGDFGLKFADRSKHYVTEANRTTITNGTVLLLSVSPTKLCLALCNRLSELRDLLGQLGQQPSCLITNVSEQTLKFLLQSSDDRTFVAEWWSADGPPSLLADIIESYSFKLSSCHFADEETTAANKSTTAPTTTSINNMNSTISKVDPKTQHQPLSVLWTSYWQLRVIVPKIRPTKFRAHLRFVSSAHIWFRIIRWFRKCQ